MRLSERKIDYLCDKIVEQFKQSKFCEVLAPRAAVIEAIKAVIEKDLKTEDEIDAEAHRILDQYKDKMGTDVSYHSMFKKVKSQLARERKFTC